MAKRRRKRVSRERVRQNARQARGGKGWLNIPDGMKEWAPEKKGNYLIDIVPYEVTTNHHPDDIEQGVLWYKHPFQIHHGVGVKDESLICPESVGKPCPICEERAKLAQDWDNNEDRIRAIQAQRHTAYNILNPDDEDSIAIFVISKGKFPSVLETELDEGPEENLNFYDVTDEGKTIKARFSKASFKGRDYLECTRIDFRDRGELDEDEILEKTIDLSEIFNVPSYDQLKAKFLELDDFEDEEEEEDDEVEDIEDEEEEEEEPEDEDEEEEEEEEPEEEEDDEPEEKPKKKATPKVKKKTKKKAKKKKSSGNKCPIDGGEFGETLDEFEECETCDLFEDCEETFDKKYD